MRLRALIAILFLASAAGLATAQPEPSPIPFRPATAAETETEIAAAGPSALELAATDRCDATTPRSAVVTLRWQPSRAEGVTAQRVDITKLHEGFEVGRFETSGVLSGDDATAAVAGPEPGIHYYWRVLTFSGTGWAASRVGRFEVPVCPWDPPDTHNLILSTPAEPAAGGGAEGIR